MLDLKIFRASLWAQSVRISPIGMPNFDPQKHHRRSIRLKGFDYSQPGAYFVTMVTYGREMILGKIVRAVHEPPRQPNDPLNRRRMVLPNVIGYLKMNSSKQINQILDSPGVPVWQRGYYEHVIRDDRALNAIRNYIRNNPLQWETDEENPNQPSRN